MKKLFVIPCSILLGLCLCASSYANADWEWSQAKGWTQGLGKALPTPGEQLKYAWQMEKDGRYMNAAKQYFLLLKTFPDSDEAGVGLQRLANCLFLMENYYDSYKALEQVIKSYPLSAKKSDLIKIEFLIGRKFQKGARRNLLDDNEAPSVSKATAIEIFKSVIDNDPVGPYAGAATLAVGYCYKDLNEPKMGIVYTDRVINEFSMSSELVAKARILKKTLEVMEGKASVSSVKTAIKQAEALAKDEKNTGGQGDFAPVTDYDEDIRELEEAQAKKLWDAAEFYKSRGSRESITAYKFSLEQLIIRLPNTTYAQKARRIIGDVKIPPKKNSFGKFNIPMLHKKKEPTFVVQPNSENHVQVSNVPVPGAGTSAEAPISGGSVAMAKPATPPTLRTTPSNDLPTTTPPAAALDTPKPAAKPASTPPQEVVKVDAEYNKNQPDIPDAPAVKNTPAPQVQPKQPKRSTPVAQKKAIKRVPRLRSTTPLGESGAGILPGAIAQNRTPPRRRAPAPVVNQAPTRAATQRSVAAPPQQGASSAFPAAMRKAQPKRPVPPAQNPAAESKARSTANDAAAQNNKWDFSEDFQ